MSSRYSRIGMARSLVMVIITGSLAVAVLSVTVLWAKSTQPTESWLLECQRVERLKDQSDEASFEMLLSLLAHKHDDVSYAAAESLQARGQKEWSHRLVAAVRNLPRDRKWYGYRALRSYPTKESLIFLVDAMKNELSRIEDQNPDTRFDSRNYFYIAESIHVIVDTMESDRIKKLDHGT